MGLSRENKISPDFQVPPTPPPLPSFIRRNIENKARKGGEFEQYGRNVKLILPPQPGETSTDDHLDVVEARSQWRHGNTRRVEGRSQTPPSL